MQLDSHSDIVLPSMILSYLNLLLPTWVIFFDFVTTFVCSQGQTDSIYFDFRNAFDILPHALLYQKICICGLSYGSFDWFLSYLTNRHSRVRYSGILSTHSVMQ
jgi:hypothetical protein